MTTATLNLDRRHLFPDDRTGPTYPLEPIIELVREQVADDKAFTGDNAGPVEILHRITGIPNLWIWRHLKSGLTPYEADALACRFNQHPALLWPSWFDDALDPDVSMVKKCRHGHEYTPENEMRDPRKSNRCRTCYRDCRERQEQRRLAKKDALRVAS